MSKKLLVLYFSALLFSVAAGPPLVNLAKANFIPEPMPEHNFEVGESGTAVEKVGTDVIQRNGTLYTFTKDVFGSLVVLRNNVLIDGAGYTLQGNGTGAGIFLQGRSNVTVRNLKITNFTIGIEVAWSSLGFGIDSSNIIVQENMITNTEYGIYAESPRNITILENTITNNVIGVFSNGVFSDTHSIHLSRNNISNNTVGIKLDRINSDVYHNNFLNNTLQANTTKENWYDQYTKTWQNNYPKEGNFWSDYNGTDANGDGIGDSPYVIDENNMDNYPLMEPVLIPDFSEAENLTVTESQPFPITLVAITSGSLAVIIMAGILVYFRKRTPRDGLK